MLDDHGFEVYEENPYPIAYLLTFRTYGTWLHGDPRGSYGRNRNNRQGTKRLDPNVPLNERMSDELEGAAVFLTEPQRKIVSSAITAVCEHRSYLLRAMNIRSNHVHVVVSKSVKPEKIVNDFKAYSTRALRREWEFSSDRKVWARGASTRYLWKPKHMLGVSIMYYILRVTRLLRLLAKSKLECIALAHARACAFGTPLTSCGTCAARSS